MASCAVLPLCFLTSLLLLAFSSSVSASFNDEKVKLDLYYETLCPGCASFIVDDLREIFATGVIDIVHLHLVPFGNAKVGPDNRTITCQHGQDECSLNMVEACAIKEWPDVQKHYPFLYCVESLVVKGRYPEWESCFPKTKLDPKPIADCLRNGTGEELELKYANETNSLVPPHKYVPWVVVNGKHIEEIEVDDLINIICEAYKGSPVPAYCHDLTERKTSIKHVCHVEEEATGP